MCRWYLLSEKKPEQEGWYQIAIRRELYNIQNIVEEGYFREDDVWLWDEDEYEQAFIYAWAKYPDPPEYLRE